MATNKSPSINFNKAPIVSRKHHSIPFLNPLPINLITAARRRFQHSGQLLNGSMHPVVSLPDLRLLAHEHTGTLKSTRHR